jgi:hypothetical protein
MHGAWQWIYIMFSDVFIIKNGLVLNMLMWNLTKFKLYGFLFKQMFNDEITLNDKVLESSLTKSKGVIYIIQQLQMAH